MDRIDIKALRQEMRPFLAHSDGLAVAVLAGDFIVYLIAVGCAVAFESVWLKILFSVIAGTMISTLFVIGHDAVHGSLTSSRRLNQLLGRLVFLPSLHNFSLWVIQHNRAHHQAPNVKGMNSWSPLSVEEFRAMAPWRRALERIYRGGGFGLYYLIERWWKDKFIPPAHIAPGLRRTAWWDLILLAAWLVVQSAAIIAVAQASGTGSPVAALFWGFVVPFTVWNCNMGLTVFLQHTHFHVPWFHHVEDARAYGGQEDVTIHVRYPRWYGLLSHEIMEHPAHHVNPMIPFYNLHRAQQRLNALLGGNAVIEHFGARYLLSLMRCCKLYDYTRREWLDFTGKPVRLTDAGAGSCWRRPA